MFLHQVGAARAIALECERMLLVPIIIDDTPLPLSIQDDEKRSSSQIRTLIRYYVPKIEHAITAFSDRQLYIV